MPQVTWMVTHIVFINILHMLSSHLQNTINNEINYVHELLFVFLYYQPLI